VKILSNFVLDGIMDLAAADALGVPVEFESGSKLMKNTIIGIREYGIYNQPANTWSDYTSMTLYLVASLCNGLDYNDIMINRFFIKKCLLRECFIFIFLAMILDGSFCLYHTDNSLWRCIYGYM